VGVLSLVLAMLCWLIVRDRPEQEAGAHDGTHKFDRTLLLNSLLSVVRNRSTWPAILVNTGVCGAFFTFAGLWTVPYLMQMHEMSRLVAASHLLLWFGGFAVGCLLLGTLSDRLGRRKPVIIVASHLYSLVWLWLLSGIRLPVEFSYAMFAVLGVATSGFSLTWACAKEVNPPMLSGMSTSVTNMGSFLAAALFQPLVGWVMDLGWRGEMVSGVRVTTWPPGEEGWG
ncbi:MAG: MFS transporter, partial [Betaproteobacteria bacterium]|nr:MFS transporter [Betaproteobacteria bacterium]